MSGTSRGRRLGARVPVAVEQIEGPQGRMLRDMLGGPGTVTDEERRRPPGKGRYWCIADAPAEDDADFRLRRIYRTTRVPEDARCEECGIDIREIQAALS